MRLPVGRGWGGQRWAVGLQGWQDSVESWRQEQAEPEPVEWLRWWSGLQASLYGPWAQFYPVSSPEWLC